MTTPPYQDRLSIPEVAHFADGGIGLDSNKRRPSNEDRPAHPHVSQFNRRRRCCQYESNRETALSRVQFARVQFARVTLNPTASQITIGERLGERLIVLIILVAVADFARLFIGSQSRFRVLMLERDGDLFTRLVREHLRQQFRNGVDRTTARRR